MSKVLLGLFKLGDDPEEVAKLLNQRVKEETPWEEQRRQVLYPRTPEEKLRSENWKKMFRPITHEEYLELLKK